MNSAMMPSEGTYTLTRIDAERFAHFIKENAPNLESYIGYQSTADHIYSLTGVRVPVIREQTSIADGDTILICKLKYRAQDISMKGSRDAQAALTPDDFEYFIYTYTT